ncbi:MAG: hypothetical protein JSU70_03870 [Phycisphaerales bacterium]|nr:MAG: hypothetical protein JSU70_03870 [Phycisphaerales bacterium]
MRKAQFLVAGMLVICARVIPGNAAILYGTARTASPPWDIGDIYKIDTEAKTSTPLVDISAALDPDAPPVDPLAADSPNGNALDSELCRFYFTTFTSPGTPANRSGPASQLYYVDLDLDDGGSFVVIWAGALKWHASDGAFYDDKYWYIGHGRRSLRAVSFRRDGTIEQDKVVTKIQLPGPKPTFLSFGDIEFDGSGTLYLTGAIKNQEDQRVRYVSGTVDIDTGDFDEIGESPGVYWGQIGFGPDGVLYGHDAGSGEFYTVDTFDGSVTTIFEDKDRTFTDLASSN